MFNLSGLQETISSMNTGSDLALKAMHEKNSLEREAMQSNIKSAEQSENQIKLLNQLIELQNKSILENQKTSDKTLRQNRVLIVLGSLTLLVALAVPILLALLGN